MDRSFCSGSIFCFAGFILCDNDINTAPKSTTAGMDPTQAQVMKYMPVMFSVFFCFSLAALCLYTVVNTGVQLGQQSYLYKQQGALNTD